ncbi:tetratricopeptide repeat protein [Treponema brennaborense]|uniref:Tetratricopeptide TPR_1 repeat-containing protein n=1 Tax=Treponema brennaborense (strain DSM 12168 / CIP 105900 / DD5/3) TaxID=906968 RepID=F4LJU2_TREBD|nr:tetratricopeptide repeat protein [Treponema brennaborense]AEE16422.1 Tetratricopeptide TPR_1 repeat-containing protein [Treponema brennaborense DSM 12168]
MSKKSAAGYATGIRIRLAVCCLAACLVSVPVSAAAPARTSKYYFDQGQKLQSAQDWYGAVESYYEAVRLNPAYGAAWFSLAECNYEMGEYSLALTYLESAGTYSGKTAQILNLTGFCYLGLQAYGDAERTFKQVLASYPNDIDARFGLAQLDILEGRLSGAEQLYLDALKRQTSNRRALLSLSLVSAEMGKTADAERYIEQALRHHGDDAEVHYVAAWLAFRKGDAASAERQVRAAVNLAPALDKGYELLASVLFELRRYEEVIDVCDYRIGRDRNAATAWYLKGLSLQKLERTQDAYDVFAAGLAAVPQDEIMRAALELIVTDTFAVEDGRRRQWSAFHAAKAGEYEASYQAAQAEYEYRAALRLDPLNLDARAAYGALLEKNGRTELYLEQLCFISAQQTVSVSVSDTIEAYDSLLSSTLGTRWNVDPFYLDKTRWHIGVYVLNSASRTLHPEADGVTVRSLAELFNGNQAIAATAYTQPVSYAEAFRRSRSAAHDYFVLVEFEQSDRELLLTAKLYSAATGTQADVFRIYRTGNDRYAGMLRRLYASIRSVLPVRGTVIARRGENVLLDLGSADGIEKGARLTVVKSGKISVPDQGAGITYADKDVLGTATVTEVGEEISQARYERGGFFDRLNIGDEAVPVPSQPADAGASVGAPQTASAVPQTAAASQASAAQSPAAVKSIIDEITGIEYPVLSGMLDSLR